MVPRIDSHQHFWRYSPEAYPWIGPDQTRIQRDFLPMDLKLEIDALGIDGVVAVQARTTLEETEWLTALARQHAFIRGVVGWVPLCGPKLEDCLVEWSAGMCGVREVCQGQAEGFMLRPDFVAGVRLVGVFDLTYDVLIYEGQLREAIELVDLCPNQTFVLDHLAKPRVGIGDTIGWGKRISEFARRENVYAKISGLVTEADPRRWTEEQLRPYFEVALEAFGPRRLMFGSDWPVCLSASEYARWFEVVDSFIANLSKSEQKEILGGTALRAYQI